ncbi:hypothetical protein TKK_0013725 [Trichogramma kaykai]
MIGDEDKNIHIINLCVVQQTCITCADIEDIREICPSCGVREHIIRDNPVKSLINLAMDHRTNFKQIILIAHNSSSFDSQFVFKILVEKFIDRETPEIILKGTKIILIKLANIKFIDGLNYFHVPLKNLPKTFGLGDMAKGDFPHFSNKNCNKNYIGPLPLIEMYGVDAMNPNDREKFLKWHKEQRGKFPIAHPELYVGSEECKQLLGAKLDVNKVDGLIACDILPPQNLFHPVLPIRMNGRLIFALCRTCAATENQNACEYENEEERSFRGVWVSVEIQKAVQLGYKVLDVFEIWKYETTQYVQDRNEGGIFAEYMNAFYQEKATASGFPSDNMTESEKDEYIRELETHEGVQLNRDEILFNPGRRYVAKLCCNTLWGKTAQKMDLPHTLIIKDVKILMELLCSNAIIVDVILPVNEYTLYVNFHYRDEAIVSNDVGSVVLAAFTTAQTRLLLPTLPLGLKLALCGAIRLALRIARRLALRGATRLASRALAKRLAR